MHSHRFLTACGLSFVLALAADQCLAAPGRAGSAPPTPSPAAHVCRYMPLADIKKAFDKAPVRVAGIDADPQNDKLSICTANFADGTIVRVEYAKPGSTRLPGDVTGFLAKARSLQSSGTPTTIQEFGDVGCFSSTFYSPDVRQYLTTCGKPSVFMALNVVRTSTSMSIDAVRKLLTAATRNLQTFN